MNFEGATLQLRPYTQSSSIIHFGLGMAQIVDEVLVTWPSGVSQTFFNVSANQTLVLQEPEVLVTHKLLTTQVLPGETLKFEVTLKNLTNHSLTVDYWGHYIRPDGTKYPKDGEAKGPVSIGLQPFETGKRTIWDDIPQKTSPGIYTYKGFVGYYPSVSDQSGFDFQVLP